jgi:hypothetical protein
MTQLPRCSICTRGPPNALQNVKKSCILFLPASRCRLEFTRPLAGILLATGTYEGFFLDKKLHRFDVHRIMAPMEKQQPEDRLSEVRETTLFNLTGKFGSKAAIKNMDRGAKVFLMALRDIGGTCPDTEMDHARWGMACRIPGAKSFRLMRNCMQKCGWIDVIPPAGGGTSMIHITEKGKAKAAFFESVFSPEEDESPADAT